jgi:hypothetical protein
MKLKGYLASILICPVAILCDGGLAGVAPLLRSSKDKA